jgi:hypothetical protein
LCPHLKESECKRMAGMWEQQTRHGLTTALATNGSSEVNCKRSFASTATIVAIIIVILGSLNACCYVGQNGRVSATEGQRARPILAIRLFRYLPERTEENHEQPIRTVGLRTQNQTRDFLNTKRGELIIARDIPHYYWLWFANFSNN